ncbi:MAG: hypothetical protein ACXAB4_00590 [Candidatus Hodarchaeales archaeon]|jgi:hypothetical protein
MSDGMTNLQQHEMYLAKTHASGAQEWICPICFRRFLLHLQPESSKINTLVLEEGDVFASHIGNKDSDQIQVIEIQVSDDEPVLPDELLKALEEALKDVDFDD